MRTKYLLAVLCILASIMPSWGTMTQIQKLHLKDGSILEGYVSLQRPGKDLVFTTIRATVVLDAKDVKSITNEDVAESKLEKDWVLWANEHDAWKSIGADRYLAMSNIITDKGKNYSRVFIEQQGAQVRFVQLTTDNYTLGWDVIDRITVDKRPKVVLSGVDRVYKLASGQEYKGQYAGEVPGKLLNIYAQSGTIVSLDPYAVTKYSMVKLNPEQTLFEQSELLDEVKTANGSYTGLIIEQNYNDNKPDENYILVAQENGNTVSVRTNTIQEFRKIKNEKNCNIKMDIILGAGEMLINRQAVQVTTVSERDQRLVLDSLKSQVAVKREAGSATVLLETNLKEPKLASQIKIVKVSNATIKEKKKMMNILFFTYEDLVKNAINPEKVETSVNQTTRMNFKVSTPGLYVVYDGTKTVVPFTVID